MTEPADAGDRGKRGGCNERCDQHRPSSRLDGKYCPASAEVEMDLGRNGFRTLAAPCKMDLFFDSCRTPSVVRSRDYSEVAKSQIRADFCYFSHFNRKGIYF